MFMPKGRNVSTGGLGWGGLQPAAYSLGRIRRIFYGGVDAPKTRLLSPPDLTREEIQSLREQLYHALNRYRLSCVDDETATEWSKAEGRIQRTAASLLKRVWSETRRAKLAEALDQLSFTQRRSLYVHFDRAEAIWLARYREGQADGLPTSILETLSKVTIAGRQMSSGQPSQVLLIEDCVDIWERVTGASAGGRTDETGPYGADRSYSPMEAWLNDIRKYVGGAPFTLDRVRQAVMHFKKRNISST